MKIQTEIERRKGVKNDWCIQGILGVSLSYLLYIVTIKVNNRDKLMELAITLQHSGVC